MTFAGPRLLSLLTGLSVDPDRPPARSSADGGYSAAHRRLAYRCKHMRPDYLLPDDTAASRSIRSP